MASDDDISAGLGKLGKLGGRKPSRLSQFLNSGDESASAKPVRKTEQPKPLSMMPESDARKADGSLAHIGKGTKDTITFQEWTNKLSRTMPFLGKDLSRKAQTAAANGVAGILRRYLLEGVDPQLSGFTIGRRHNATVGKPGEYAAGAFPVQDHIDRSLGGMALAALAPHVVVNTPKQMRTGHRRARNGKAGSPGVFARGFAPCTISFDSERYDKIAYILEHGMIWKVPPRARKAMMAQAIEGGFTPTEKNTTGYWEIPPRPFQHVLTSSEVQRVVRQTAEAAMMGTLKQEMAKKKEIYEDAMGHASVDIESVSDALSHGDSEEDWTDLIEFGPRKRR